LVPDTNSGAKDKKADKRLRGVGEILGGPCLSGEIEKNSITWEVFEIFKLN